MMPLYLYLLIGSVSIPLLYTIFIMDPIKYWRNFIISTTIMAAIFLIWDAIFTHDGVWWFNKNYCLDYRLLNMPIEEWLFFFIIPFCSLFIHFALQHALPTFVLGKQLTKAISWGFIAVSFIILIFNYDKAYSAVNYSFLMFILFVGVMRHLHLLQRFILSFVIILIPFFLVNGALTGAITPTPIVIYNDAENLGIRLLTIPIEDIGYAFTMLFGNLMIFESLNKKKLKAI